MATIIELLEKIKEIKEKLVSLYQQLLGIKKSELHVIDLAKVMARFEGYYLENSRARRNKNPLNLKWSKFAVKYDPDGFCVFIDNYLGWKACLWDLEMKCKGYTVTGLKPTSTIKELIYVWSATDQEPYTRFVCQKLKISQDYQLQNFSLKEIYLTLEKRLPELVKG
jgi:hypothetical protein